MNIVKIEIASQASNGVTRQMTVHGPGKSWQNLVADELEQAGIPSGDLVHLCFYASDGVTCVYRWFTW